ncbi:MAG: AraC family transcriptional regulator [Gammaproteobacteria bacterium]|nr:AraC family transcriptional regulator [Gammaproteobacteria bacterium]
MTTVSLLNIGFSILSAMILFIAYVFFFKNVNKSWYAISSCAGLLISLSFLQLGHLEFFLKGADVLLTPSYRFWLFLAPPMFFYFSRATLLPEAPAHPLLLLHLAPVSLNYLLRYEIAVPMIFLVGMGYSFWLSSLIYGLRTQRQRFKIEMFFFALFSIFALFVLLLGLSVPYIDHGYFYTFYTNSIGLSFVLIVAALMVFPGLLTELAELSKLSYAASTLNDVDVQASLNKLDTLMKQDKLYQNENLNLAITADAMNLTPHQLSELVNRQFGVNFSRYVREKRVEAAKALLINEPKSSVLSIGLETGFSTQSNFYAAFKEITGISPGAFRKSPAK